MEYGDHSQKCKNWKFLLCPPSISNRLSEVSRLLMRSQKQLKETGITSNKLKLKTINFIQLFITYFPSLNMKHNFKKNSFCTRVSETRKGFSYYAECQKPSTSFQIQIGETIPKNFHLARTRMHPLRYKEPQVKAVLNIH